MNKNENKTYYVNDYGHLVIPKNIRNQLGIYPDSFVTLSFNEKNKILTIARQKTYKERAKSWIDQTMERIQFVYDNDTAARMDFDCYGRAVVCVIVDTHYNLTTGIAVCSPNDKFSLKLGMCIAFCRAVGRIVPDFILKGE